jgi:uncharacterized protein DUF3237
MNSRRAFMGLSGAWIAAGLGPAVLAGSQPAASDEDALRSELLLDLTLQAQRPITVGFPGGERSIVTVTGGSFQGPRLKGTIAPGGGDWIVQRPDGTRMLDVRIVMTTDDEQRIYVTWRGLAYTENGTLFARIVPVFETGSDKYAWLNRILSVGVYRPKAGAIAYRVFRIL